MVTTRPKRHLRQHASVNKDSNGSDETTTPHSWSTIELCPVEVTHIVLDYLDWGDILALRYTSKRMCSLTRQIKFPRGKKFGRHLARIEAVHFKGRHLPDLTCSRCGKLCKHDLSGFEDRNYRRSKLNRECISCLRKKRLLPIEFYVKNVWYGKCHFCRGIVLKRTCVALKKMSYFEATTIFGRFLGPEDSSRYDKEMCLDCQNKKKAEVERERIRRIQRQKAVVRERRAQARRTTSELRLPKRRK